LKRAAETITRLKSQLAEANSHLHVSERYVVTECLEVVDIVAGDDDEEEEEMEKMDDADSV
jgi:hypothetical protein